MKHQKKYKAIGIFLIVLLLLCAGFSADKVPHIVIDTEFGKVKKTKGVTCPIHKTHIISRRMT